MADQSLGGKRVPIVDPVAHFWSKVDRSGGPDACWPWGMSCTSSGYGQYQNKKVGRKSTHVYAYELEKGPIPEGFDVDHTCHNADPDCPGGKCAHRRCCNPAHLEAVPPVDNHRRGKAGRGKSHCVNNHLYDVANTMWIKKVRRGKTYDTRMCRTCNRDRARARS